MSSRLNPYISFHDNAREALDFYASVLGGTPQVMTFGQMGEEGDLADQVMHGFLETDAGYALMASDTPPGMDRTPGGSISISLSGDDAEQLRGYFQGLAEGGSITTPLEKQMWGDEFGMLTDRFGITWLVDITAPAE